MKNTAGSGDLRHALGGFEVNTHEVPVPMSFLKHLLCAAVRGHCSGLELLLVCSNSLLHYCLLDDVPGINYFLKLLLDFVLMRISWKC